MPKGTILVSFDSSATFWSGLARTSTMTAVVRLPRCMAAGEWQNMPKFNPSSCTPSYFPCSRHHTYSPSQKTLAERHFKVARTATFTVTTAEHDSLQMIGRLLDHACPSVGVSRAITSIDGKDDTMALTVGQADL